MRQTEIFAGSSHPALVDAICARLGQSVSNAELGKFANGETKVNIQTSVRDKDVFIVQSGSKQINDSVMELLVMISACKSGSAKSVTAVMPYFPYSRQSKKKSHRGAITARMLANLLHVAGVNHVITIDLHANQMQGFFKCPVDNLVAEPLIAHWIKGNISDWRQAVVVSKNAGGTKRVTSLADALKLSFGIIMTDRRRPGSHPNSMHTSVILEKASSSGSENSNPATAASSAQPSAPPQIAQPTEPSHEKADGSSSGSASPAKHALQVRANPPNGNRQPVVPSPLSRYSRNEAPSLHISRRESHTPVPVQQDYSSSDEDDEDDGAEAGQRTPQEVVTGRIRRGHVVDDDDDDASDSPTLSVDSALEPSLTGADADAIAERMAQSTISLASSVRGERVDGGGLGGSGDAAESSDDEEQRLRDHESTVTLVGNVRDKPVFIIDDMIDKPASWIAAAETVVKRGGALRVYCFATHGLFGDNCLAEMEACEYIDGIIVTDSFPVDPEILRRTTKLRLLDTSNLLSESIRRNHHGESMSQLFIHYN